MTTTPLRSISFGPDDFVELDDFTEQPTRARAFGKDWIPTTPALINMEDRQDPVQEYTDPLPPVSREDYDNSCSLAHQLQQDFDEAVHLSEQRQTEIEQLQEQIANLTQRAEDYGQQSDEAEGRVRGLEAALADCRDQLDEAMELSQDQRRRRTALVSARTLIETRTRLGGQQPIPSGELIALASYIETGLVATVEEMINEDIEPVS